MGREKEEKGGTAGKNLLQNRAAAMELLVDPIRKGKPLVVMCLVFGDVSSVGIFSQTPLMKKYYVRSIIHSQFNSSFLHI